ncbi:MotA/TolQ/ExbB proton channel family protein [Myxococcota bacterium]|nr:MotA/TolQ/ExbB proton channel family protein [Myxococcota bacterium]
MKTLSITTLLTLLFCAQPLQAAGVPSFEKAFKIEKSHLEHSRKALASELQSLKESNQKRKVALEDKVRQLVRSVSDIRRKKEEARSELMALESRQNTKADHADQLDSTLEMAAETLKIHHVDLDISGKPEEVTGRAISQGLEILSLLSRIHIDEDQAFFDENGYRHTGKVVHIGHVAALATSPEHIGGVLGAAPDGTYRVVDSSFEHVADQLARGESVKDIPIFLFDPHGGAAEPAAALTVLETANLGGPIAWIILSLAVFGILLVIERLITLSMMANRRAAGLEPMLRDLADGHKDKAIEATQKMGAFGKVARDLLASSSTNRGDLENEAMELVTKLVPTIERSISILNVLVMVSPLLGLLGTVTGMISTFNIITEHGTGDPKLLSGGISEALITTKFGLAVAIPLLLAKTFVSRWGERILESAQTNLLAVITTLSLLGKNRDAS